MAENQADKDKAAADAAAAEKDAADKAEAEQAAADKKAKADAEKLASAATSAAKDKPNDNVRDQLAATDERPPKTNPGVEARPAAEPPRSTGDHNLLDTRGLTPAQAARVNGTPLDGAHGAAVLGISAVQTGTAPFRPAHEPVKGEQAKPSPQK